jgi:predicted dehydrogenase
MVKQARKMVAENQFGNIRKVMVEYPQGWLSTLKKTETNKQLGELTLKSGMSGCMGDIGTHAAQLNIFLV